MSRKRYFMFPLVAAAAVATSAFAADSDWSRVAQALGKSGSVQAGGVYRVGFPRTDLHVSLDGVVIKPGFALGGWVAFEPMGEQTMVMGDLVLTQDEVNPVVQRLEQDGIGITALHNHLLRAEPMTLYMHIMARGDPMKLATAIHAALALSNTPLGIGASGTTPSQAAAQPISFDTAAIDEIIGHRGKDTGGVYQLSIPRAEPIKDEGIVLPEAMGSAIAINFEPTGSDKAAITGDFVLTEKEVNPVIKAMRDNGIEITALHSHMLDEQPRVFFLHFWANDDVQKLARGLRAALDQVDAKKG